MSQSTGFKKKVKCTPKYKISHKKEKLYDLAFGDEFLNATPIPWSMEDDIYNLDLNKIKTCALYRYC